MSNSLSTIVQRMDGEEACEKCGAESHVSDSLARQFIT
jgi:hypothetical protein